MMPVFIGSFVHGDVRYFVEHSTVVDAPVSCAMTESEFIDYYIRNSNLKEDKAREQLRPRLERAIRKGSSAIDETEDFNGLVWVNRAGPREGCLTVAEYKKYVLSERVSCGLPAIGTAIAHGTTAGQTP
jgi:hypothetical protein